MNVIGFMGAVTFLTVFAGLALIIIIHNQEKNEA